MYNRLLTFLKTHKYDILFVLIVTAVFSVPLFSDGIYVGHDTSFHLYRLVGTFQGLQDHQFPVRIYPLANNGFGYASPLFYCDYFLYPFAVLYGLGMPLVAVYKLVLISFFLLTAIICLYTCKYIFKEKKITAYAVTFLYMFSSYHVLDAYVRSALGEVFSLTFIPLVLLAFYKILKEHRDSWILLGISFVLLLFSHMISFGLYCLLFAVFIIGFAVINRRDKLLIMSVLKTVIKAVVLAVALSAVFLFPFIEQSLSQKFVFMWKRNYRSSDIAAFFHIFAGNDKYHDSFFKVVNGDYLLICASLLSLFFDRDKLSRLILFLIFVVSLATTNIIDISNIGFAHILQFSFRLHLISYPLACYLAGRLFERVSDKKILYSLLAVMCLFSLTETYYICDVLKQGAEHLDNSATAEEIFDFRGILGIETSNVLEIAQGEYLPQDVITDYLSDSLSIKEHISEWGWNDLIQKYDYVRNCAHIEFYYVTDSEQELMLPQTYYKGYQVFLTDGEWIKLDTYDLPYYHQVTFKTVPGAHHYTCIYKGTLIQKAGIAISGLSLLSLLLIIYRRNKTRR